MTTTTVELNFAAEVATLQMVPPPGKPPTLDESVLADFEAALGEIERAAPRAVVLRSASERFFCVGANLVVLRETNEETIVPWVLRGHRVLNRLEDLPCPVIAMVRGYAMGGGLELAMACDLIVAEASARFAQSEAKLGFIPGWGGCRRLVDRIGAPRAKRLFYTGEMIEGPQAAEWGLVDFCVAGDAFEAEGERVCAAIRENNAYAINTFKALVNERTRAERERNGFQEACRSVGCLRDEDTRRRLDAFLTKKK